MIAAIARHAAHVPHGAQTSSLPYCSASILRSVELPNLLEHSHAQPIEDRRHTRLETCGTSVCHPPYRA